MPLFEDDNLRFYPVNYHQDDPREANTIGASVEAEDGKKSSFADGFSATVKAYSPFLGLPYLLEKDSAYLQEPDPGFNPITAIRDTPYAPFADRFMWAKNPEQIELIKDNIDEYQKNQEILGNSGAEGIMGGIAGGFALGLDPVNVAIAAALYAIPFIGPAAGTAYLGGNLLRTIGRSAFVASRMALSTETISQIILHQEHEALTIKDSAYAIGGATLLGGVVGGAIPLWGIAKMGLGKKTQSFFDIANVPESVTFTVSDHTEIAPLLKRNGLVKGVGSVLKNPLLSSLTSDNPVTRRIASNLSESGVIFKSGAPGIVVETSISRRFNQIGTKFLKLIDGGYKGFLESEDINKVLDAVRRFTQTSDTFDGFSTLISQSLRRGDVSDIKEVEQVAKAMRPIINEVTSEANALDLFGVRKKKVSAAQTKVNDAMKTVEKTRKEVRKLDPQKIGLARKKVAASKKLEGESINKLSASKNEIRQKIKAAKIKGVQSVINKRKSNISTKISASNRIRSDINKRVSDINSKRNESLDNLKLSNGKTINNLIESRNKLLKSNKNSIAINKRSATNLKKKREKALLELKKIESSKRGSKEAIRLRINNKKRQIKAIEKSIAQAERSIKSSEKKISIENKKFEDKKQSVKVAFEEKKNAINDKTKKHLKDMRDSPSVKRFLHAEKEISKAKKELKEAESALRAVSEGESLPRFVPRSKNLDAAQRRIHEIDKKIASLSKVEQKKRKEIIDAVKRQRDIDKRSRNRLEESRKKVTIAEKELQLAEKYKPTLDDLTILNTAESYFPRLMNKAKLKNQPTEVKGAIVNHLVDVENVGRAEATQIAQDWYNKQTMVPLERVEINPNFIVERGPFKDRTFLIPDSVLEPWLVNDAAHVLEVWLRTMITDIEMTKVFGDANMAKAFNELITHSEAMELKAPKQASKINRDKNRDIKNLSLMRDRLKGMAGLAYEDGALNRVSNVVRNYSNSRFMGRSNFNTFIDIGQAVMFVGTRRIFGKLIKNFISQIPFVNRKTYLRSRADFEAFGLATDFWMQSVKRLYDGGRAQPLGSRIEREAKRYSDITFKGSLVHRWDAWMRHTVGISAANRITRNIKKGYNNISSGQRRWMENLGIMKEDFNPIKNQINKYSETINGYTLYNTPEWKNLDALNKLGNALSKVERNGIILPGVGDLPKVFDNPAFKMFLQFRSFSFAALNRSLIPALQRTDATVISGIIVMIAGGVFKEILNQLSAGNDPRDLDWEEVLWRAIKHTDVISYLGDIPDGINALRGKRDAFDTFGGTVGNLAKTLVKGTQGTIKLVGDEPLTKAETKAITTFWPFQNLHVVSLGMNKINDYLDETFGKDADVPEFFKSEKEPLPEFLGPR